MPHGTFNLIIDGSDSKKCQKFLSKLEDTVHSMCDDFGVGVDDLEMEVWAYGEKHDNEIH